MINPTQVNWSHLTHKRNDNDDEEGERSSRGDHKNIDQDSHQRKFSHHRRIISSSDEDSNWPNFADEDYIIFCFREDGAFQVVKNNGNKTDNHDQLPIPSSCLDHHTSSSSRNSRPVNRKLNYGDNTKTVMIERCNNDHESLAGKLSHEVYPKNYGHKMVEENIYLDSKSVYGGNFEEHRHSSNASSSSFAFPKLGWEWTGSPEKMPKSKRLCLRKHKTRCVVFQCCKF
ncbi:protein BREAKING OF ASYMMETRY IN THE STOMATAL LINEAGE-like isoform X2 [Humulus lupulus]|uniref:protein BREAKING OF ASYMMETRY IN THE STOMATAL LINEAGE-like isoform X2 n=1 Tax=Humulus lupulus TaxID=3486 RepID=UPI002B412F6A|nr:protein BREAKING OF ASYMMETRY IN THE STOMATAL LINEAGE-like isoform X2 [Humulus lupulus]